MPEEGGQVRQSVPSAVDPQRGVPIRIRILEVESDPVTVQPRVREAAKGRHDSWRSHGVWPSPVEAIRPFARVVRVLQAGQVLAPGRMSGIKATAQAKPDIEIGVVQESACHGQVGQDRDLVGKLKLEIKERFGVNHAVRPVILR
jgi:hypothetical protein